MRQAAAASGPIATTNAATTTTSSAGALEAAGLGATAMVEGDAVDAVATMAVEADAVAVGMSLSRCARLPSPERPYC